MPKEGKGNRKAFLPSCGFRDFGGNVGWVSLEFSDLSKFLSSQICIADSLAKDIQSNREIFQELIGAIPSPLARMWFYYIMIGLQEDNAIKKRALEELRDIWMVLAFRNELNFNVTFETIDLFEKDEPFIKVVKESLVGDDSQNSWLREIRLILLEGHPIAITSPLTLIFPTPDYETVVPTEILRNNLKKDILWKRALYFYICHIRNETDHFLGKFWGQRNVPREILHTFGIYITDELERINNMLGNDMKCTRPVMSDLVNIENPNSFPEAYIKLKEDIRNDFEVPTNGGSLIVIPSQGSSQTRGYRIYGLFNSSFVNEVKKRMNDISKTTPQQLNVLRRIYNRFPEINIFFEDVIWTDRIITFTINDKIYSFYPFREEFVEALDKAGILESLHHNMSFDYHNGYYRVTLKLARKGGGSIEISKTIREVRMRGMPPLILVYPHGTNRNRFWYVARLNFPGTDYNLSIDLSYHQWKHESREAMGKTDVDIYISNKKVNYIKVRYVHEDSVFENVSVVQNSDRNDSWRSWEDIAILFDIGTTNTTIMLTAKDREKGSVVSKYIDEILWDHVAIAPTRDLLDFVVDVENKNSLSVNLVSSLLFLPKSDATVKYIPTLYRRSKSEGKAVIVTDKMLDNFKNNDLCNCKDIIDFISQKCESDIKWVDYGHDKRITRYILYLTKLTLMTQDLTNSSITIYASQPTKDNINEKYLIYELKSYLPKDLKDVGINIKLIKEYEALTYYFYNKYRDLVRDSIVVDMGGGSSEIVYWHKYKLKFISSVRVGGNTIFMDSVIRILKDAQFVKGFHDTLRLIDEFNLWLHCAAGESDAFKVIKKVIECQFGKIREEFLDVLSILVDAKLYVFLYLIFWGYFNLIDVNDNEENITVNLFLGGNMSRVFKNLFGKNGLRRSVMNYIYAPLEIKHNINVTYSDEPKLEVIQGMHSEYKHEIFAISDKKDVKDAVIDITPQQVRRIYEALLKNLSKYLYDKYYQKTSYQEIRHIVGDLYSKLYDLPQQDSSIGGKIGAGRFVLSEIIEEIMRDIINIVNEVFINMLESNK